MSLLPHICKQLTCLSLLNQELHYTTLRHEVWDKIQTSFLKEKSVTQPFLRLWKGIIPKLYDYFIASTSKDVSSPTAIGGDIVSHKDCFPKPRV